MTLEELLKTIGLHPDEFTQNEILQYELQFHYDCIWYHLDKFDRIDHTNKRIILKSTNRRKETR